MLAWVTQQRRNRIEIFFDRYSISRVVEITEAKTKSMERFIVSICGNKTKDEPLAGTHVARGQPAVVRGMHGHSSLSEWISKARESAPSWKVDAISACTEN